MPSRPALYDEEIAEFRALYHRGLTYKALTEWFGLSASQLRRIIKKLDLPLRRGNAAPAPRNVTLGLPPEAYDAMKALQKAHGLSFSRVVGMLLLNADHDKIFDKSNISQRRRNVSCPSS